MTNGNRGGTILISFLRNPFNLWTQRGANWVKRAELAGELIIRHSPPFPSIADLGCGDQKLRIALGRFPCSYQGYDLNPQSSDVRQLNVVTDRLPECDVTVLLGVLEYVPILPVLRKVASPLLVVSHIYPDEGAFSPSLIRRKKWANVLTKADFESSLSNTGFTVIEAVQTVEKMQYVWIAQRLGTPELQTGQCI